MTADQHLNNEFVSWGELTLRARLDQSVSYELCIDFFGITKGGFAILVFEGEIGPSLQQYSYYFGTTPACR